VEDKVEGCGRKYGEERGKGGGEGKGGKREGEDGEGES